jgi:hypothetical protein
MIDARVRGDARSADQEGDAERLVIGVVPFLVHAPVRPEHVAVIRRVDDDGVVAEARRLQPPEDALHLSIDELMEVVIESSIGRYLRLGRHELAILIDVIRLAARLRAEGLALGGRLGDLGHGVVVEGIALCRGVASTREGVRGDQRRVGRAFRRWPTLVPEIPGSEALAAFLLAPYVEMVDDLARSRRRAPPGSPKPSRRPCSAQAARREAIRVSRRLHVRDE